MADLLGVEKLEAPVSSSEIEIREIEIWKKEIREIEIH